MPFTVTGFGSTSPFTLAILRPLQILPRMFRSRCTLADYQLSMIVGSISVFVPLLAPSLILGVKLKWCTTYILHSGPRAPTYCPLLSVHPSALAEFPSFHSFPLPIICFPLFLVLFLLSSIQKPTDLTICSCFIFLPYLVDCVLKRVFVGFPLFVVAPDCLVGRQHL